MLRPTRGVEPLLRRPFSVADADPGRSTLSFLGKNVGHATRALGSLQAGDALDGIAPLGKPFRWEEGGGHTHVLLAGGIGIAPFPLLARRLAKAGERVVLLYGGRRSEDLVHVSFFEDLGVEVRGVVEEGPGPASGRVTDLLQGLLREEGPEGLRAYSCGPTPMLKAAGGILQESGVPHQAALEEYMGCGFGVCVGCAVPVHVAGGDVAYERCCMDGPVFEYTRLAW
jgi:dihydroorotate dehydrogenase electron transfer subunit